MLWYVRSLNPTMRVALKDLASSQMQVTKDTTKNLYKFLNFCSTHPDAFIRYHASVMVLYINSNTLYITAPESCSPVGGYYFLGYTPNDPTKPPTTTPTPNGPIHTIANIIKNVVDSATEAEAGGLFTNSQ